MDVYVESQDIGIEVKSDWTFTRDVEKNLAKWRAASLICSGGFEVHVFDRKKHMLVKLIYRQGKIVLQFHDDEKYIDLYTNE